MRTISATGGTVFWLANGSNRLIVVVGTNTITTLGGLELHEGDNSSRLVTVRVGYDGISGLYYVWRNGILIGDAVPPGAATGRKAIFLIDCCSSIIAEGELDYVCWEATGVYPPATIVDETPPAAPTGLAATGSFGAVILDWDSNAEDDLANYNVYRAESAGGPYDLLAEAVTASAYTDMDVVNGTEYFYVATAVDGSGNESDEGAEGSATPNVPPELGAAAFPHGLLFEENGVLPSVEGAADGWMEDAAWNQNDPDPPTLTVFDGRLIFGSVLGGQQSITMQADSAWANEIDSSTSYTFEVSLRIVAGSGDNPGATLWFANGATRMILLVGTNGVSTLLNGTPLDDSDNSADFVTIRVGYDAVTGLYYVWRDGVLIGDALPDEGGAANGRTAVFLVDCCSSVEVAGEFDHVYWTAGGLFSPDSTAPADPTGLAAVAGSAQVALDWEDNDESDLAGYDVLRSESAGGPYDAIAFTASSEFVDNSVVNSVTYFYVIAAIDTSGNASGVSSEADATPITSGGLQIPGDCNQDSVIDISDAMCLFRFLFTGQLAELPCGDGSQGHPANIALTDWNGDGTLDISDGSALLGFLFINGPPHVLGLLECVPLEGCEQDICNP